ncbi:4Fe-4S binding protein, partial [Verrucomicrobiota bacterium]
ASKKGRDVLCSCHAFVLIGAELPVKFLNKQNVRLEGEWTGGLWSSVCLAVAALIGAAAWGGDAHPWSRALLEWAPQAAGAALAAAAAGALLFNGWRRGHRFAWLGIAFLICYTVYGVKLGNGVELWPFRGWGYKSFSFFGRPWGFWYTVLYCILMTVFGIPALKKWGIDHKDRYQVYRYASLLAFQWILFFIVPEFLFQAAVEHRWVGERLAADPQFAGQAWRAYGIAYAWPLFFYTFFYDPHQVWIVWGVVLAFVIIPVFCFFHGKRYCTWICGCGGLAETLGDRWRVLAPKGRESVRWESMSSVVLWAAFLVTGAVLVKDILGYFVGSSKAGLTGYKLLVDVWLVGIIPVTLYPFLGGKVWCRYWCPLAKMMGILSHRLKGRFAIYSNDKCIACYQCSRHCQVGIPVMRHALKQEAFGNWNSSCIGCGICVTVCPMDVLSFTPSDSGSSEHSDR